MRKFWKRLGEFLHYRETLSCFILLTKEGKVEDFTFVTGRSARKCNEVDFAFEEFIDYQMRCNCSQLYIPPLRIIRLEVADVSKLPKGNRETAEYIENFLLTMVEEEGVEIIKYFDFRCLHFVLLYGVYPRSAIYSSVGVLKTPLCKARNYIVNTIGYSDVMAHEHYSYYREMLNLQDEKYKSDLIVQDITNN